MNEVHEFVSTAQLTKVEVVLT